MNIFDKIKRSMDLDDPRRQNVELMEKYIERIPTEVGKKYALSKLLNDPKYGMTDPTSFKNQNFINDIKDAWSLKYQDDYTPPDIEKTLSKANKEQAENFWNWDSDEHWTKHGTDELKRQADRAGYGDNLAGYLDKVRELQTDKDKHKASERFGYNVWGSLFAPRTVEAVLRGKDPSKSDIGLDAFENAMYLLNPVGRLTKAGLQGAKAGKYLGRVVDVADVLANPLIMETADALAYGDKDNTDRKNFSIGDVAIGTGINAGMNKLMPFLFKNRDKLITPVQKSKAQIKAEQSVKDNEPLITGLTKEPISSSDLLRKIEEEQARAYNLLNEDLIREKYPTAEAKQKLIEMFENKRNMLSDALNKYMNKVPKTKFSERLFGDLDKGAVFDYASNKAGDVISEDPKLTKQLLTRSVRGAPLIPSIVSDLARDYYNRKEKNVEQEKINQDLKSLKLLGNN